MKLRFKNKNRLKQSRTTPSLNGTLDGELGRLKSIRRRVDFKHLTTFVRKWINLIRKLTTMTKQ